MSDHNRRGPGPLPDRWLRCPRKANNVIANKFLAFKTPLDEKFNDQISLGFRFTPAMLFEALDKQKIKLGLWINLTRTERFYDRKEVEDTGCRFVKIECHGHDGPPTAEQTTTFIKVCKTFLSKEPLLAIGVHCTHGFNRTGFLLVSFLVEEMDYALPVALNEFARVRPPGIYKEDYIKELFRRYDDEEGALPAPPRPDWCFDDGESNDNGNNGRDFKNRNNRKKPSKFKDNPTFMEGVPGIEPITDRNDILRVRQIVQRLTNYPQDGFVGSQPVSMDRTNMNFLAHKPYRVSWKADGTRYMMLIASRDEVYFVDRDNSVFKVHKIQFFVRGGNDHLNDTLLDGEMVIDKFGDKCIPRYLVYDIVFINGHNVGEQPFFPSRLRDIEKEIIEPRIEAMKDGRIRKEKEPFSIRAKPFYEITRASDLLGEKFAKQLTHEPDGLIFQPAEDPYTYGQSPHVLKWKPMSMNSIDFRLQVKPETRLGYAYPYVGILLTNDNCKFAELAKCTKMLKALDGKIIECKLENNKWVFMRERTDKSFPNSRQTADAVMHSIRYPVTEGMLLEFIELHGWKDPMPPPTAVPPKRQKLN